MLLTAMLRGKSCVAVLIASGLIVTAFSMLASNPQKPGPDRREGDVSGTIPEQVAESTEFKAGSVIVDQASKDLKANRPGVVVAMIPFHNGESVEVEFRRMAATSQTYPARLSEVLGQWKIRAMQGDAETARLLAKSLRRCADQLYRSDDEFDSALDRLQQTHTISRRIGDHVVDVKLEPAPDVLAELRHSYEFCRGVEDEDRRTADRWLELAAEQGSVKAQLKLGMDNWATEAGRDYLKRAWFAGNIDAASWLARSLSMTPEIEYRNLVAAYAYQSLYADLVRADFSARGLSDSPVAKTWMAADAEGLAEMRSRLTPHELREAQELTKMLLIENEQFCTFR